MKPWPVAHRCPWPGCTVAVDPSMWGCKHHWYALPRQLRTALWHAYKPGQDAGTASPAYRAAYADIVAWMAAHAAVPGAKQPAQQGDLPL